jgi:hypothetical protein
LSGQPFIKASFDPRRTAAPLRERDDGEGDAEDVLILQKANQSDGSRPVGEGMRPQVRAALDRSAFHAAVDER